MQKALDAGCERTALEGFDLTEYRDLEYGKSTPTALCGQYCAGSETGKPMHRELDLIESGSIAAPCLLPSSSIHTLRKRNVQKFILPIL